MGTLRTVPSGFSSLTMSPSTPMHFARMRNWPLESVQTRSSDRSFFPEVDCDSFFSLGGVFFILLGGVFLGGEGEVVHEAQVYAEQFAVGVGVIAGVLDHGNGPLPIYFIGSGRGGVGYVLAEVAQFFGDHRVLDDQFDHFDIDLFLSVWLMSLE